MSFFSIAQRHRFSLVILSIWIIAAFVLNQDAALSGERADFSTSSHNSNPEKSQKTLVAKETPNLAIWIRSGSIWGKWYCPSIRTYHV